MFEEWKQETSKIPSYWYKLSLKIMAVVFPICFLIFIGFTIYAFIRTGSWVVGSITLVVTLILDTIFILCVVYCAKSYKKAIEREKEMELKEKQMPELEN